MYYCQCIVFGIMASPVDPYVNIILDINYVYSA
jgi:hypothetical protein